MRLPRGVCPVTAPATHHGRGRRGGGQGRPPPPPPGLRPCECQPSQPRGAGGTAGVSLPATRPFSAQLDCPPHSWRPPQPSCSLLAAARPPPPHTHSWRPLAQLDPPRWSPSSTAGLAPQLAPWALGRKDSPPPAHAGSLPPQDRAPAAPRSGTMTSARHLSCRQASKSPTEVTGEVIGGTPPSRAGGSSLLSGARKPGGRCRPPRARARTPVQHNPPPRPRCDPPRPR